MTQSDAERAALERVVSGQSWEAFCDALKLAGLVVQRPKSPDDPFDRAEGYRYLSRIARAALEAFVEHADPHAPVLARTVHETAKMGSDNPDNHYYNATIDGRCTYRISGTRGTVHYLAFGTQSGGYGENMGLPPTGFVEARELQIDDDGRFELIVSRDRREGNWLPMTEDSGTLIVRQTFLDHENEIPAELRIERIDGPHQPAYLTPQALDQGLAKAGRMVGGAAALFANWAEGFMAHTNELPLFDPAKSDRAGGDPNIRYYHSYWALEPGQALVVEVTPPDCDHWNFQINNHWMESLDYRYWTIHVNKHSAQLEADGSVRIVVADEDPGLPNWLHTTGHRRGTMCFRWIRAQQHPQPRCRVVTLEELRNTGASDVQ